VDLQDQVDRGAKAQRLLADPLIGEAFDAVRAAIHSRWEQTPLRDTEGAHELKLMIKLLGDVRAVFEHAVTDGKLAAAELERINSRVVSPAEFIARRR